MKTSLSRNFVHNLQTFLGFCQVRFMVLLQIQRENNFLLTTEHRQAKFRRFLGICLYDYFIYRTNFVFRKCLETRRHLGFGRKTVNSERYSELWQPIKTRENLPFTDLVNTKNSYRNITLDQSAREKSLSYYKMTDRKLILLKLTWHIHNQWLMGQTEEENLLSILP